jgi:hypothetical protein
MQRYFKLVCSHEDPAWYIGEFLAGRARFGWSGPGTDLRAIKKKMDSGLWRDRTEQEAVAWTYTQFLIEHLRAGDRLVIQPEQPLRRFLLAEVVSPPYQFSPGDMDDFNHVINVKPLTTQAISVNAKAVSAALKHDLSKRGHYYQIYPEDSIRELNAIVTKVERGTLDFTSVRTDEDTFDDTHSAVTAVTVQTIARHWRGKDFEKFCERICQSLDYVEVIERSDRGKGFDLLIRILNPVTGTPLLENVPVQCKNYSGEVSDFRAIEDLERSIRHLRSPIAYLFIMGVLTPAFLAELERRKKALEQALAATLTFEIVGQDRIAELYFSSAARNGGSF